MDAVTSAAFVTNLRVFGRIRFDLLAFAPSSVFNAIRSSGEICLNAGTDFGVGIVVGVVVVGDVNDFIFSFSMSRRIFSFRRRRSSSFQSRERRGRAGSAKMKISIKSKETKLSQMRIFTVIVWALVVAR